jgi:hypothetical protein
MVAGLCESTCISCDRKKEGSARFAGDVVAAWFQGCTEMSEPPVAPLCGGK